MIADLCSHVGCLASGLHPQQPGGLIGWLCDEHHKEWRAKIDATYAPGSGRDELKKMLGAWVRAGGGARAMADKMLGKRGLS